MYPDLITPRAHPDLLSRVDYDPYALLPGTLPPAPRVFTTAAHLARARQVEAAGGFGRVAGHVDDPEGGVFRAGLFGECRAAGPAGQYHVDQHQVDGLPARRIGHHRP